MSPRSTRITYAAANTSNMVYTFTPTYSQYTRTRQKREETTQHRLPSAFKQPLAADRAKEITSAIEMAEHHNSKQILTLARELVCKVQTLIENK